MKYARNVVVDCVFDCLRRLKAPSQRGKVIFSTEFRGNGDHAVTRRFDA